MAPSRTDDTFVDVAVEKRSIIEDAAAAAPAPAKKGKYNAIPGPLGLASASLEGKVALVTGAGKCNTHTHALSLFLLSPAKTHNPLPAFLVCPLCVVSFPLSPTNPLQPVPLEIGADPVVGKSVSDGR